MKMIRKYMAMFLALALMAALFGCGGANQSSGSSDGSSRKISEAETTAAAEPAAKESAPSEKAASEESSAAESSEEEPAASEASAADADVAENKNETQAEASSDEKKSDARQSGTAGSLPEPVGVLLTSGSLSAYGSFDYRHYAEVIYAKASLTEESAKKYPALAKAMEEWNQREDERSRERLRELQEAAKDLLENRPDDVPEMFLTSEIKGSVLRADSAAVSIFHDYYSFEGGVHPNYSYSGVNFDTETGKELKFTDVVSDPKSFFVLADEVFQEKYAEIYESMTNVCKYMEENDPADPDSGMCWSIDPEGVTVYFNPYILGSYSMGAQTAKIYFQDHPEVFVEKYTKTPDSYAIPLIDSQELKIDTDGDGKRELFEVQAEPEEPGQEFGYYKWIVNSGERSLEIADYCYSKECYVVRANDQYYLYLFETSDNDYSILGVLDLKTFEYDPEKYLFASLAGADSYWHDDEATGISESWYQEYAFTDPGRFLLTERMDILGTRFGRINAKVDKDGYPEYTDPWYTLRGSGVLQANTDLECDYVDEQGKLPETEYVDKNGHETDHGTLEEGTYVFAVRTDGKTWIDLQEIPASEVTDESSEDYSFIYTEKIPKPDYSKLIYRIYIDSSEWPFKAAGKDEAEAFRGIQYAG